MKISAQLIKELRNITGSGVMHCKEALKSSDGNIEKAREYLKLKGMARADKKADRETSQGSIGSYIHQGNKIGVMIEINCETDFVAKTDDFQQLIKDVCMHIAASRPLYIAVKDIPENIIEHEKSVIMTVASESGKTEEEVWKKYYTQVCLLEQPFVKDLSLSINDLVKSYIAKLGENIIIKRFVRFELGE